MHMGLCICTYEIYMIVRVAVPRSRARVEKVGVALRKESDGVNLNSIDG